MASAESINVEFETGRSGGGNRGGSSAATSGVNSSNSGSGGGDFLQQVKHHLDPFNHSLLENVLASLVFVLFILVIVLGATHGGGGSAGGAGLDSTCQDQLCLLRSASTLALANLSANPCEDFYQYACGLTPYTLRISPTMQDRTVHRELTRENADRLEEVLRSPIVRDTERSYERKVKTYFTTCTNDFLTERLRGQVLSSFLGPYLYLLNASSVNGFDFNMMLALSYMGHGAPAFFEYFVMENYMDGDRYTISIGHGGLGMPHGSYLSNGEKEAKHRDAYKTYIRSIAAFLVTDADPGKVTDGSLRRVDEFVDDVMEIEMELARIRETAVNPDVAPLDPANMPNLDQLDYTYSFVKWTKFFGDAFSPNAPGTLKVAVQAPDYLNKVSEYVNNRLKNQYPSVQVYNRKLSNYINWRMISHHVGDLSSGYVHAWREFQSVLSVRPYAFESRFDYCFRRTRHFMRHAVSGLFVAGHSSSHTRQAVDNLYKSLQTELTTAIDQLGWIDAGARTKSKEKVAALVDKIGYEPGEVTDTYIDAMYGDLLIDQDDFMLDMAISRQNFHRQYQSGIIGKLPDRNAWDGATYDTNLHLNNQKVRLTVPAGIIQWPYFERRLPDFINYATLGQLIAAELVKSIDATGQLFDKEGKMSPMWATETILGYVEKATCLNQTFSAMRTGPYETSSGKQYINIDTLIGRHLRNVIAGADGLRMSLQAYQRLRGDSEAPLPLARLNRMQNFFVAWSQMHCYSRDPDYSITRAQTLRAMPEEAFVNGILSSMPEFQQAFACPSDAGMVRSAGFCPGVFYA